ncbi:MULTISPECIES: hypothetical protein [Halocynthiibacter]|uniref:Uncharacterized protein n=1 Tax=Halocynthiibacter halioticoli TaxID=2986804 RepID=A0AAE3LQI3_9RHOB|nr:MULTISPECIES: hypothetical protein [Halocynthiibacter]MCV6823559.1 hypothetical protein [Halocynthiibacter halioticoli]MCW4056560.1 hypothetical protein [Halocynthiibacter sp. SDUM655004]
MLNDPLPSIHLRYANLRNSQRRKKLPFAQTNASIHVRPDMSQTLVNCSAPSQTSPIRPAVIARDKFCFTNLKTEVANQSETPADKNLEQLQQSALHDRAGTMFPKERDIGHRKVEEAVRRIRKADERHPA